MFNEELKLSVSVRLSAVTGLIPLSEPDNESTCPQHRRELEQELYEFPISLPREPKNETREEQGWPFSFGWPASALALRKLVNLTPTEALPHLQEVQMILEKVPIGRASTRLAAVQAQQPPEPQVGAQANESNVQKPKTDEQRITFRPGEMPVPSQPPRWTRPFIPPEPRPFVNLGARPRTSYQQQ